MADIIFPSGTPDATPESSDKIMFSDTSDSSLLKDCLISDLPISTLTQNALNLKENKSEKNANNGYAGLDATGKIPGSLLTPGIGLGDMIGDNNLSELTDESIARTNLGLGTLATQSGTFSDKEDIANKSTSVTTDQASNIKYPSVKSVYDWVTGAFAKYSGDADFYQYSIVRSVGNLIDNNSFETDLSGYTSYNGAVLTRDITEYNSGIASMKIVTAGSGLSGATLNGISTTVGKNYSFSFFAKGNAGKKIRCYLAFGGYDTYTEYTMTGSWMRCTHFCTIVSGTTLAPYIMSSDTSSIFYIDQVQIEEGTLVASPFTTTQGNLTVSLKNYEGNDPTPSKPVKIMIGGVVRTITSALSWTETSGVNFLNLGSAELATKEVDLFVYINFRTSNSTIYIGFARIPTAQNVGDFSINYLHEKGVTSNIVGQPATDQVVNIGRFNAILSGGAGYTWSIPATSVIVNRPIYETRVLEWNETISAGTSTGITSVYKKYTVSGHMVHIEGQINISTPQTTINSIAATLPFSSIIQSSLSTYINDGGADVSSGGYVNWGNIDIKKIGNFSGFIVIRYSTSYVI